MLLNLQLASRQASSYDSAPNPQILAREHSTCSAEECRWGARLIRSGNHRQGRHATLRAPCGLCTGPLNYNPVEEWFFHRIKAGRPIVVPGSGQQVWFLCTQHICIWHDGTQSTSAMAFVWNIDIIWTVAHICQILCPLSSLLSTPKVCPAHYG